MWWFLACTSIRGCIMDQMTLNVPEVQARGAIGPMELLAENLPELTDIRFFPNSDKALVLQKTGEINLWSPGEPPQYLVTVPVQTTSEQGLLSVAIPNDWSSSKRIYLHRSLPDSDSGEVAAWNLDIDSKTLTFAHQIITVDQPYANHNGGHIQLDQHGMLLVGFGDGGWRNDPHSHGQNKTTALGTVLRLNPEHPKQIPPDNPFVNDENALSDIWVYGLRNPWKFDILPDGSLIVADVGQNAFEEVSILKAGDNAGWKIKEGTECFEKSGCQSAGLVDPIWQIKHPIAQSITGGVWFKSGEELHYVCGDFATGLIWVLRLGNKVELVKRYRSSHNISTFSKDRHGNIYLGDFAKGDIYQLKID